ncbi:unnamed protein product [Adineta steineri]|nr:unnamed protein product [Adineta steineri]CAF1310820.1 unnamed protein product [Adineta steineri]CAF4136772.1 unnamed protein product [Adineta steineri]
MDDNVGLNTFKSISMCFQCGLKKVFSVGSLEGYTGDNNCWVNVVMVPNLSNSKKNGLRNGLLAFLGL